MSDVTLSSFRNDTEVARCRGRRTPSWPTRSCGGGRDARREGHRGRDDARRRSARRAAARRSSTTTTTTRTACCTARSPAGLAWFGEAVGAADLGPAAASRLRAVARAYVEWGIRNPAMYRLMYEQRLPRPAEGEELERRRSGLAVQRAMLAEVFLTAATLAARRPGFGRRASRSRPCTASSRRRSRAACGGRRLPHRGAARAFTCPGRLTRGDVGRNLGPFGLIGAPRAGNAEQPGRRVAGLLRDASSGAAGCR